jgi:nickel-dependent lactate racemase
MPERVLTLPWGESEISLSLPENWHLVGTPEPSSLPGVEDTMAEVQRSLASPVGSPRLSELVGDGTKRDDTRRDDTRVALVIDDGSRPTPISSLAPAVLAELERGGVQREQITVVTALGLHRPMAEDEIAQRVGAQAFGGLRWENHDCDDPQRLALLGTTSHGSPVWINRTVAEADLIVSIGCIEPHIIASFGGGYKNLIPGVAGRATIAHNHTLNCAPDTFNMVGQPIANNPMRLDLEEGAQMLSAPVFVVNAVLNNRLEVVRVVAGDPVAAHRAGVQVSAALYGARVERPADVVIATSHPMDQDLRQGVKALANTVRAVRPGGVQLVLVRAEEGVGVFGLANRRLPLGRGALKFLAPLLLRVVPRIKLQGMGEEDRFFLYFALQAMRRARLLLYAPTIPGEVRANLPFVEFVDDVEAGLALARERFPGPAEVLVFPHGGITYPIMD